MNPEFPFLAAGAVAITGGAIREGHWPSNANRAIIGTVALTIVASASGNSRFGPLVHAVGLLLLLTATMAAIKATANKKKVK